MKNCILRRILLLLLAVLICSSTFFFAGAVNNDIAVGNFEHSAGYTALNQKNATQNQKNMVARADYFYGITWVAQETVDGWSGTFYKGGTYRIPYGQPIMSGQYVGYGVSIEKFLEAASRAGSIFYTGRSWCDGTTAPYYATDCSAFVSWVWGIERRTTYFIPAISTNLGNVTTDRATYTLQLGDALNSNSHVVMVTGLSYNASGAITNIEITEQTPPQMKRSNYTPYQLYLKYSNYTIQRYYGDVPAAPGQPEETWIEKAAFDVMVYRDRNPDLAGKTDAELKKHWLESGIKEGRASSTVLDLGFYLNNNPDLKEAFGTDYEKVYNHFINSGYKEYRKSSALFDGSYYCANHPDVASSYKENYMRHYVENGIKEGRRASLTFDPDYYWFIRPDVYEAWPDNYAMCAKHYAGHGINAQIEAYDHEHPVISNAVISDVTAEGYTVTCTVTDNWGLRAVAFPTWTLLNNQDDLAADFMNTQRGTQNGNTYTFTVKASDHNNETGAYVTHIYAKDKGGNTVSLALNVVNVENPHITVIPSLGRSIDEKLHYVVGEQTTVDNLLSQFENEGLQVKDSNGYAVSGTSVVGTGATINLYRDGEVIESVTVVVPGDLDGNGIVDTTDYLRLKAAVHGSFMLNDVQTEAADVDETGSLDSQDYQNIKSYFLGNYNLRE